jgi:Sulfotransferase family
MTTNTKPPIFIIGPPRCGTTLMAVILGAHEHIFATGETHFCEDVFLNTAHAGNAPKGLFDKAAAIARLRDLYARYNEPVAQAHIDQVMALPETQGQLEAATDFGDLWARFMRCQMASHQLRWVNHTPRDVFYVTELRRWFPGARFIGMVRDPRDFLCSYRDKWRIETGANQRRLKRLYHPILTSLVWRGSVRRLLSERSATSDPDILIVRYEDLVRDPDAVVAKVCAFVGETPEPPMMHPTTANSSSGPVHETGIFAHSVDRWRGSDGLPAADVTLAQWLCRTEMHHLEYACVDNVSPLELFLHVLRLPWHLAVALWVNRARRGPLFAYLRQRLRS